MDFGINEIDFSFPYETRVVVFPIIFGLIGFCIFWFTYQSEKIKAKFFTKYGKERGWVEFIFFSKVLGGITMGILPLLSCILLLPNTPLSDYGLIFQSDKIEVSLIWIVALSIIFTLVGRVGARNEKHWQAYPQMRIKTWKKSYVRKNVVGWVLYLLGYEVLFRGVLLFTLHSELGFWPAVGINIIMYSGTHIPKGIMETIGAAPLAFVVCIAALQCGSVWPVAISHIFLATSNFFSVLKHNPELEIIK